MASFKVSMVSCKKRWVRSQNRVTPKGVLVRISESGGGQSTWMMISSREGARHGSASGVAGANGPEQAEGKGKKKASAAGRTVGASPANVAGQTGRLLAEREHEWLERLTADPASFADVELEVHEQTRRQADLYVAGLLAKASEQAQTLRTSTR